MSKKELTVKEAAKMGGNALKKMMPKNYFKEISAKGLRVRLRNKKLREQGK